MEWIGPAVEAARTGSPFVAGGMFVAFLAGVLIREIRRHHASEIAQWNARYSELYAEHLTLKAEHKEAVKAWLTSEREFSQFIRTARQATREVGG